MTKGKDVWLNTTCCGSITMPLSGPILVMRMDRGRVITVVCCSYTSCVERRASRPFSWTAGLLSVQAASELFTRTLHRIQSSVSTP